MLTGALPSRQLLRRGWRKPRAFPTVQTPRQLHPRPRRSVRRRPGAPAPPGIVWARPLPLGGWDVAVRHVWPPRRRPGSGGRAPRGGGGSGGPGGLRPRARGRAGGRGREGRRAAARGPAWQGYLLHGPLDGGVWRLGLLEQLQDLLKPLLVRFPLILHLGLLHIKPDTGKEEQMLVPRTGPPRVPAPARRRPVPAPTEARTRSPAGPLRSSAPTSAVPVPPRPPRAPGADQTESPRICNLAPRSAHGSPLGPSATEHTHSNPAHSASLLH